MQLSYFCHPRLSAGLQGSMVGNQRLHMRQGEFDAACGYHCVLMALMLLGHVRRSAVAAEAGDARLVATRAVAQQYYFEGCDAAELKLQLEPYAKDIDVQELRTRVAERTFEAIEQGHLCLVGFSTEQYMHWVLAVGIRYEAGQRKDLLVLDPVMAPIPLVPWNGLLLDWGDIQARRAVAQFTERVVIDSVLVLAPSTQATLLGD